MKWRIPCIKVSVHESKDVLIINNFYRYTFPTMRPYPSRFHCIGFGWPPFPNQVNSLSCQGKLFQIGSCEC